MRSYKKILSEVKKSVDFLCVRCYIYMMDKNQINQLVNGDKNYKPKFPFQDLFKNKEKYKKEIKNKTDLGKLIFKEFERCYSKWRYFQLERLGITPSFLVIKGVDYKHAVKILLFLIDNEINHYDYFISVSNKADKLANHYYQLSYLQHDGVMDSVAVDIKKEKKSVKHSYTSSINTNAISAEADLTKAFPALSGKDSSKKISALFNLAKTLKRGMRVSASEDMLKMARYCIEKGLV